ncbi:hypothetical protein [Aliiroseovarius sp. F47248L]|uniref:hypothetical protein n=1 Tax=Aliiroseovarius sp. F47248L TaxID=2926420 RepID=UPI001FF63666|nr:hypothetical protein [Aliiroseovarius sp. F47248L]MCK0140741.1 hypothetical protein [Aliiroseovarius sp. F47248L]
MWTSFRLACLALALAGPARAEFDGSGVSGGWLREIALGRFEIARGAILNEADVIARQTKKLTVLAMVYHAVYEKQCAVPEPAQVFSVRVDWVKRIAPGIEETEEGTSREIRVRLPYADVFGEGMSLAYNPVQMAFVFGPDYLQMVAGLTSASVEAIRLNECGSAELEVFERNLAAIVRGEPSLQRQGVVPTHLEARCGATGVAGLDGRMSVPVDAACDCLSDLFWKGLPEDWLARIEDGFSRETVLLSAALSPELWEGARSCLR